MSMSEMSDRGYSFTTVYVFFYTAIKKILHHSIEICSLGIHGLSIDRRTVARCDNKFNIMTTLSISVVIIATLWGDRWLPREQGGTRNCWQGWMFIG